MGITRYNLYEARFKAGINASLAKKLLSIPILGTQQLTAKEIAEFVYKKKGYGYEIDILEIANAYIKVGKKYGVRGDIAFCQAIIETGWFKFEGGTAVKPSQHNYCGMGVTSKGIKGNSFNTVTEGVTAHIQHLYAYGCTKALPIGEKLVDPRFKYVERGCAKTFYDLGGKWSSNSNYGKQIIDMYNSVKN